MGVILYGTRERLSRVTPFANAAMLDVEMGVGQVREELARRGITIAFDKKDPSAKPPTMAIYRCDRALMFSVYSANTTTDTAFRFPLGAPILIGAETVLADGCSHYRFARSEHREYRIFVEQADGVISCREAPPVNARYRRAIRLSGLRDATVRFFSEAGCECAVSCEKNTDRTPLFDERFRPVSDGENGEYLEGRHVDGSIYLLIGRKTI